MFTKEEVILEEHNIKINACVLLQDGKGIDITEVYIETEFNHLVPIRLIDLKKTTISGLYEKAETAYNDFMHEVANHNGGIA